MTQVAWIACEFSPLSIVEERSSWNWAYGSSDAKAAAPQTKAGTNHRTPRYMSQWRYKAKEGELGPVSFQELADLVRNGKVAEGALVCREGAPNWEPAWHVPGLLRAAGIVEPGDSPMVEKEGGLAAHDGVTPALPRNEREIMASLPRREITLADVVRGIVAAAVGVLAVGFFYRWASQAMTAFPMPPTIVDGETIDCYFPLIGRCTLLECGLLYVDVFAVAAVATWHAVESRVGGRPGPEMQDAK